MGGQAVGRSDGQTVGRSDGRTVGRSDGRYDWSGRAWVWVAASSEAAQGGWYGALSTIAAGATPLSDAEVATAVRNNALATAVAPLIGLIGAVLGGWMGSGEPVTFTHHRTRDRVAAA
jgi:hypothetical protein